MKIEKVKLSSSGVNYKKSSPYLGKVLVNESLTEEGTDDDVRHIVVDIADSGIEYLEGQSLGVIPPGMRDNGKPHAPRLYSIASEKEGDTDYLGTVTFSVKRTIFTDPDTGGIFKGLCSNFLCDCVSGDEVPITGPIGNAFLLPEDDNLHLYLIATGTGVAPFRSFLDHIKRKKKKWAGGIDLYFGVKTQKEALYLNSRNNDLNEMLIDGCRVIKALSREEKTLDGQKMYVQNRMLEDYDSIKQQLDNGKACFYLCGLKGMEKGIEAIIFQYAEEKGLDPVAFKKQLRSEGKWNVEVY